MKTYILDRSNEKEIADLVLTEVEGTPEEVIAGLSRAILLAAEQIRPSARYRALEESQEIIADGLE